MAISVEVHRLGLGKMPGVCKGLPQSHESVFKSLWATHAGSLPRWTHGETADLIFFWGASCLVGFPPLGPLFFCLGCRGTLPGREGMKAGISLPGSRVQGVSHTISRRPKAHQLPCTHDTCGESVTCQARLATENGQQISVRRCPRLFHEVHL